MCCVCVSIAVVLYCVSVVDVCSMFVEQLWAYALYDVLTSRSARSFNSAAVRICTTHKRTESQATLDNANTQRLINT